ncbi:probable multidrug resistance-associated protein lethal(2)03659 [Ischnura elegans]|uniref:probable multidrug resistance-associated protein lethal(2)03659 n=1 Tax=Ischnura elegans TaxID=197161 RepID=UPI001ED8A0B7|nr:probable multidrug resistance-associated protein lethal(2)03659 [Ischnura elegans]
MESAEEENVRKERRESPRLRANPLSVAFFWWTIKMFKLGYRKPIVEDHLYKPLPQDSSQYLGDKLEKYWNEQVAKSKINGKNPSLAIALLKAFGPEYFTWGFLLSLNELILKMIQPMFLGGLLSYFKIDSTMSKKEALLHASGIVGFAAINAMVLNHYMFKAFQIGMKIRIATCSLIYRKSLRLTCTALGDTAIGKVINLLSNDVARFDIAPIIVNYLWISPIAAVIVGFLVYEEIGISSFVGIAAVFAVVSLQSWTGKLTSKFRSRSAVRTDERVRLMDEIIRGIRVIKMYAWEKPFAKLIADSRRREINIIRKTSFIRGLYMTFNLFTTRMALFCAIATFVSFGNIASAEKVFVISSYFNLLSHTMSGFFVRGIAEFAEARVSIRRLQKFMMLEEIERDKITDGKQSKQDATPQSNGTIDKKSGQDLQVDGSIFMEKLEAKWNPSSTDATLSSINLNIKSGTLLGIIGSVGSGKSSLMQAILGEMPTTGGTMKIYGRVSYASQEPWVFGGTIRQNILFGEKYDERRYRAVTAACALRPDFRQLPRGDLTHVGDRGSLLSGGQRARVNLARALYGRADIFLLDDPLSAVDAHVGKHLVEECLSGSLLRGATVLLATHQIQHLRKADEIIVLEEGSIKGQGSYEDLLGASEVRKKSTTLDVKEGGIVGLIRQLSQMSSTSKRSSISEAPPLKNKEDEANGREVGGEKELEKIKKGSVDGMVYMRYFTSGAQPLGIFGILMLFALTQTAASGVDYFVSFWTKNEELRMHQLIIQKMLSNQTNVTSEEQLFLPQYIQEPQPMPIYTLLGLYGGTVVSLFLISIIRSFLYYITCMRCSSNLHDSMFKALVRAPMHFFDANPSGRILNRFSKDMGSIDEFLPKAILDSTQILMVMMGAVIVSATVNYLFLVPVFILGIIFWIIRSLYLHISRKAKRVEGITRSPIFTHIGSSLQGLPTIRAHGAQNILITEFDNIQDINSSAYFMSMSISTAFGFCLDIMCLIYMAVVTFSFLLFDDVMVSGNVGLAITQSMLLTGMFQWGVRQTAEVENQMTAVERVLEYTDIEEEESESKIDPKSLEGWPSKGEISFKNVGMSYKRNARIVIRHLNFTIKASEKVGVVGRTGAGKSSLISTLLRLGYIEEGCISIDGVNTCHIHLETLRSNISVIPQDPVLFSGTLRSNLDPFQEYADHLLWKALEDVELKEIANEAHGLDTRILEGGSNISVGQRQLLCLARAILRRNQILLLDEATANVDPKTDTLIQLTIREKFASCTVITVAHRLNTVIDYDKVLVLDEGRLVEFNHPHILLQNKEGYFYRMVQQTGIQMAKNLARLAEKGYKKSIFEGETEELKTEETTNL